MTKKDLTSENDKSGIQKKYPDTKKLADKIGPAEIDRTRRDDKDRSEKNEDQNRSHNEHDRE